MKRLADFRRSVYSQNGEDGVVAELFRRLPSSVPKWYVEFGAWDGRFGSNCYELARQGWHGVMIEGDADRFRQLIRTARRFGGRMTTVCGYVESSRQLEEILSSTGTPEEFGLLSIDIDSFDYDLWKDFNKYRPAVVIIEIDSSTAPGVQRIWSGEPYPATSFTSMVELGASKGYSAVCHTGNLIFLRNDLTGPFAAEIPPNPDELFLSDWLAPSALGVLLRKLRWTSPQRVWCKLHVALTKLVGSRV